MVMLTPSRVSFVVVDHVSAFWLCLCAVCCDHTYQVGWGAQLRVMSEACDDAEKEGISCELIDLR